MSKIARLALLAAALLAAGAAGAQTLRAGALLVAAPSLQDASFAESVVLVLRHDEAGTIGVLVNRVTSLAPGEVFPELAEPLATYDGRLFRGGPVAPTQVLLLVQGLAAAVVGGPEIVDNIYVTADPEQLPELVSLAEGDQGLRLYAGHAEWGPGQLASEVEAGSWYVVPGSADLVFHPEPQRLWREALTVGADAVVDAAGAPQGGSGVPPRSSVGTASRRDLRRAGNAYPQPNAARGGAGSLLKSALR